LIELTGASDDAQVTRSVLAFTRALDVLGSKRSVTGSIAHLDDQSKYHEFLTHIATAGGSIQLAVEGTNGRLAGAGQVTFGPGSFDATPALTAADASFF
jgi:hypothetical protein